MYIPDKQILEKYAKVMVDFALGFTKGIKTGDKVLIQYYQPAKPLALEVYKRILEKGAFPILKNYDDDFQKVLFDIATDEQIEWWPREYTKALVDTIDHRVFLLADEDPTFLREVDPKKIIASNNFRREYRSWLDTKEDAGKLTWSLCLYGTEAMAKEAGLTLEEYWEQIIKACFLDLDDPIKKWEEVYTQLQRTLDWLNSLPIDKLHIKADKTDLWLTLGEKRRFIGGRGANIPSFEIFTSPDFRGTEGHIFFDYPLYRYGKILKDIYLEFRGGKIIKATASQNQDLLIEMISQEGADQIGEFSLTDKKFSKISKFMAETLFDENFGGEYGNTHLAIGSSYHDTFTGNAKELKDEEWLALGFNDSSEHCDIIATTPRIVEAVMKDGIKEVIYKNGEFLM
jgi:aminopeptidase